MSDTISWKRLNEMLQAGAERETLNKAIFARLRGMSYPLTHYDEETYFEVGPRYMSDLAAAEAAVDEMFRTSCDDAYKPAISLQRMGGRWSATVLINTEHCAFWTNGALEGGTSMGGQGATASEALLRAAVEIRKIFTSAREATLDVLGADGP